MDFSKIIIQWKEFDLPPVLDRDLRVYLDADFITTVTGPRRAGKTYYCFQLIRELLQRNHPRDNIQYINFEDEKLLGAGAEDLTRLLDAYFTLSDIQKDKTIYLFLDEIQNVQNWDVWTRRIFDTQKNIKLILTGSSSKLLSREISTKLRGRVINVEVFPLSFKEYLGWNRVKYNLKTLSHSKDRIAVKKMFSSFLANGGYPSTVISNVPSETILQSYYESMIFKDIIERYEVKEIKKLRILASLLFDAVTREMSYTKLANKMKSMGFNISKNTVVEYVSYFEDAYLLFQNKRYEYSLAKQLGSIKKVYCIDNGLLNAVSFKFSENRGQLLENLVFIELKRRGRELYYFRNSRECDFLVQEENKIVQAIQVTQQLDDANEKREITGLLEAMEVYHVKQGWLLTEDQEEERTIEGKKLKIIPIWKWLLEE